MKIRNIVKKFRLSIFAEYAPMFLIVLILLLGAFYLADKTSISSEILNEPQKFEVNKSIPYNMPVLELPLRYFLYDSILGGVVNTDRDSANKNTWEYAFVGGDDAYQSFSTTTITLQDFRNGTHDLSVSKELKERRYYVGPIANSYDEQVEKYGDLAIRFLPVGYAITWIKEFDVDSDGKVEKIVGLCSIGGNHCPHEVIVVKDNKQIFSTSAGLTGLNISQTKTGNGFYVQWVPTKGKWNKVGLCCPLGYMKTRFVYENDIFIPVYEQEVLYFKVQNTE